jgi:hypothetical protein
MTKADLHRMVDQLPDEGVEPLAAFLEAMLKLVPKPEDEPGEDWRALRGVYKGQGMTRRLEEERAREREAEEHKIQRKR